MILKWDENRAKIGRHQKFDSTWSKPYIINKGKKLNSFKLPRLDGQILTIPINELYLKPYARQTLIGHHQSSCKLMYICVFTCEFINLGLCAIDYIW